MVQVGNGVMGGWLEASDFSLLLNHLGVSINGGTPSYHLFSWDFPLETIQLWGYSPMTVETPCGSSPGEAGARLELDASRKPCGSSVFFEAGRGIRIQMVN